MRHSITSHQKKPNAQSEQIDSNSELKKSYVLPGIQTQPAQTECHCSTTCAITTANIEQVSKAPIREKSCGLDRWELANDLQCDLKRLQWPEQQDICFLTLDTTTHASV